MTILRQFGWFCGLGTSGFFSIWGWQYSQITGNDLPFYRVFHLEDPSLLHQLNPEISPAHHSSPSVPSTWKRKVRWGCRAPLPTAEWARGSQTTLCKVWWDLRWPHLSKICFQNCCKSWKMQHRYRRQGHLGDTQGLRSVCPSSFLLPAVLTSMGWFGNSYLCFAWTERILHVFSGRQQTSSSRLNF